MAGDLQPALVRLVHRRAQLVARDLHVGLERRRAHVGPVGHVPARFVGVLHVAHLQERVRSVQVRRGRVDRGAGLLPLLDQLLQLQVHEAVHVPARPHRRHAAREVEADEAGAELAVDARTGRVVEVLVHHDEARDHRLARRGRSSSPRRARRRARRRPSPRCCRRGSRASASPSPARRCRRSRARWSARRRGRRP